MNVLTKFHDNPLITCQDKLLWSQVLTIQINGHGHPLAPPANWAITEYMSLNNTPMSQTTSGLNICLSTYISKHFERQPNPTQDLK